MGGSLFFTATVSGIGGELWKSDGSSLGTVLVKDIRPGIASLNSCEAINVNGTLYFRANDGVVGAELWKSDGTSVGTTLVSDIRLGTLEK